MNIAALRAVIWMGFRMQFRINDATCALCYLYLELCSVSKTSITASDIPRQGERENTQTCVHVFAHI